MNRRWLMTLILLVAAPLSLWFALAQGSLHLGANGSGKTTLLHTLAGLRTPDGGSVHLDGANIGEVPRRPGHLNVFVLHDINLAARFGTHGILLFDNGESLPGGASRRPATPEPGAALPLPPA